jgi:membrane protein implicated in regulation of membrane protease activity
MVAQMYIILLGVGAGFIFLSLIFGELFEIEGTTFAFLRPTLIAVVLAVMGGTGLLLTDRLGGLFVLLTSSSIGLGVGFLMHHLVLKPLHRLQNTSTHDKHDLIGTTAKVALTIPQNGYGKIKYTVNGSVVTSPAKTEDGGGIKKDTEVSILYIKDNTYFVKAVSHLDLEKVNWSN